MADAYSQALIDALRLERPRMAAQNPLVTGGNTIQGANLYDPNASGWENLALAALQGAGGGFMSGLGNQMVESDYGDLNSQLFNALNTKDPAATMEADPNLRQFAGIYELKNMEQAQQVADQERLFQQQLGKEVFTDRLGRGRDAFKLGLEEVAPVKQEAQLTDLRKEFQGLPEVKDYVASSIGYRSLQNAINDPASTSDLELVRGAIQAIEPGMAVREGEQAAVQSSGSIPDTWKGALNKALTGESSLSQDVREGILRIAERRMNEYESQFSQAKRFYEAQATRRGLPDPSGVTYLQDQG